MMPRRTQRRVLVCVCLVFGLPLLAYLVVSLRIGAQVNAVSDHALRSYPGDRVTALLAVVEDPNRPLSERNRAVWALGQLGDPRALPVLQGHRTDQPCDHRKALCERELRKAIDLLRGDPNLSALVWRRDPDSTQHSVR